MLRSTTRPCRRMGNRADAEVDGGSCGSKHAAGTTIGTAPTGGEVNLIIYKPRGPRAHRARADKKVRGCMEVVELIKDLSE